MLVNDGYVNAVVGFIVDVANRSWTQDGSRMVTLRCDDPFVTTVVRVFVKNWGDAEVLVDTRAVFHEGYIYPLDSVSDGDYSFGRNNNNNEGEEQ